MEVNPPNMRTIRRDGKDGPHTQLAEFSEWHCMTEKGIRVRLSAMAILRNELMSDEEMEGRRECRGT